MDCSEYQKHISMLIDGELGEHSSKALKGHIRACSACSNTYEQMAELHKTLSAAELSWSPPMLAARVKERLAEKRAPLGRLFTSAWRQVPLFAVIVLLAIGLGSLAGHSMSELVLGDTSEAKLQYLISDAGQSFSDIVLDIAVEENSR
jgi:predicted anti-sigma-YlaC factor YlaD